MANHEEDDGYDYLFEAAYEALEESGFTGLLVSGYEDMPEPAPVEGHMPDLTATNAKGVACIFEICPREAFATQELAERMLAFARHAEAIKGHLVLIVPEGEEDVAWAFLSEHAIPEDRLDVWEA